MARIVVSPPSAEQEEQVQQARRFLVYLNYLRALDRFITREFNGEPDRLVFEITDSRAFQRIQGGRCRNADAVKRMLRNAWSTEMAMNAVPDEAIPYSNHWAPVQAYYTIYAGIRALFGSTSRTVGEKHAATLRAISGEIKSRPGLFPQPWRTTCAGDPEKGSASYGNLPAGVVIAPISGLAIVGSEQFWDSYAMLLRTTRDRQVRQQIVEWKKQRGRKKIGAPDRKRLAENLVPTTLFDILYRLRIRSNYADADSFLLTLENEEDAAAFNRALRSVTWHTLLVLEVLVARTCGTATFEDALARIRSDPGGLVDRLAAARWETIRGYL